MKEEDKQLGGKEAQNEMHTMIPSEADESSPPKILNMDDILRHLRTGPWNLYITIVCSFVYHGLPAHAIWGPFVVPFVNHTCLPPEGGVVLDQCSYAQEEDNSSVSSCDAWEYDNSTFKYTVTEQFDMVCENDYQRATFSSVYMIGALFGAPFGGYLADSKGRKFTMVLTYFIYCCLSVALCWVPWKSLMLVLRFFMGSLHPFICGSLNTMVLEVTESKWRGLVGTVVGVPWGISLVVYGGMAYFVRDWRWLQFGMTLLAILLLPALWFIDESPRWLLVNGQINKTVKVLQKAQRLNKSYLPPENQLLKILEAIKQSAIQAEKENVGIKKYTKEFTGLMNKVVRSSVFISWYIYFACILVFYAVPMSAATFNVDPFLFMLLNGVVDMAGYTSAFPVVEKLGRRNGTASAFAICAIATLGVALLPSHIQWLVMTLALIGKMCAAGLVTTVIFYTTELLPTEIRSTGIGISFLMSRIGSILAPFVSDTLSKFVSWGPAVLYASTTFIAALATLRLPETLNKPMFDTLAEMERRKRQRKLKRTENEGPCLA